MKPLGQDWVSKVTNAEGDEPAVLGAGVGPALSALIEQLLVKLKWAVSHDAKPDQFTNNVADFVSEAAAALSALSGSVGGLNAAPPDWMPIETAPTDGTNVLLWWPFWCKGRPTIGWFGYKGIQQWVAPEALEGDGDPPTHWMPLPASPVCAAEKKE